MAGREISRAGKYNCIFARDAIDRSIDQSAKSLALSRARVCSRGTDASCATRVVARDEETRFRSASLDGTKIMARLIAPSDLEAISANFYASRRSFTKRTTLLASQELRTFRLLYYSCNVNETIEIIKTSKFLDSLFANVGEEISVFFKIRIFRFVIFCVI